MMVITLLTAIGLFAVRSASLVDSSAGYDRQALQAHFLTQYAGNVLAAEFSTTADPYLHELKHGEDTCAANAGLQLLGSTRAPCYNVFSQELSRRIDQNFPGHRLLDPPEDGSPPVPGSLGPFSPSSGAAQGGAFKVELTDPGPAGDHVPGMDASGEGPTLRYSRVTLTVTGQVRPYTANPSVCDVNTAGSAAAQRLRAHFLVPDMN